jgi:glycerol-3-phosphate dehydrogenase (NAD(P)+)
MNIGIIGLGAWGSALGNLVVRAGHSVTDDLAATDMWIVAVPADSFRDAITENKKFYNNQTIAICTKGMEIKSHLFMTDVLAQVLPNASAVILSGPQFAAEVTDGIPTGSTLAGTPVARKIARTAFAELYLEETDDVIGTELCGVGKNACAIVAGYYSIMGRGENERAMMLTRAWTEVATLAEKMGAQMRTFIGLAGTGDLVLSATSKTSRNFSAGVAIANNQPLTGTIEGLSALSGLTARAKELNVSMPVIEKIAKLINA